MERGVEITNRPTIDETAQAFGFSRSYVCKLIRLDYLETDRSTRPMRISGGFVPISQYRWRRTLDDVVVRAGLSHMIGFEGSSICVLDRGASTVLEYCYDGRRATLESHICQIREVLGIVPEPAQQAEMATES